MYCTKLHLASQSGVLVWTAWCWVCARGGVRALSLDTYLAAIARSRHCDPGTRFVCVAVILQHQVVHRAASCLRKNGLQAWRAWRKTAARPCDVPAHPDQAYKGGGWQGYGHWLGTGNVHNGSRAAEQKFLQTHTKGGGSSSKTAQQFLAYPEAAAYARSLRLTGKRAWERLRKDGRPSNIPGEPHRTYKGGGWQGWGHWLGNDEQKFLSFTEARDMVRSTQT